MTMRTPKAFFPQVPSRFDASTNLWVPKMDISPVKRYAAPHVLLPPEAYRLPAEQSTALLEDGLRGFHEDDYLVAAGDPSFMAICAFLLARRGMERLQVLRYDRRTSEYQLIVVGGAA